MSLFFNGFSIATRHNGRQELVHWDQSPFYMVCHGTVVNHDTMLRFIEVLLYIQNPSVPSHFGLEISKVFTYWTYNPVNSSWFLMFPCSNSSVASLTTITFNICGLSQPDKQAEIAGTC